MNMKNLKRFVLLILLLLTLVILSSLFNHHRKLTIKFSNFYLLSENLYIDSAIERSKHSDISILVQNAKQRIISKFGSFSSSPIIIIAGTSQRAKAYGTNDFGSATAFPWDEYVVLGPKGYNIDVLAHELLHAELAYRLGYCLREFKLPIWLDEGIGMQVDYRKKYDIDIRLVNEKEIKRVKSINKRPIFNPNHFWSGGEKQVVLNYQISKALVSGILNQDLNSSLYTMIDKVKDGKAFEDVFTINKTLHNR